MRVFVVLPFILLANGYKPANNVSNKNKGLSTLQSKERTVEAADTLIQKTRKVTIDGLTFNYVESGSGPALILIHGSISDYREWSKQIETFAQRYHVIAYSRRYHWPNPGPASDTDASLDRQVSDLLEFIKATGIEKASLIGHSFGGAAALVFTLKHPELVQSLILAEPAVSGVLSKTPDNDTVLKESQYVRAHMKEVFATGNAELIVKTYATHVAPGDYERATAEERQMLLENVTAFQLDFTSQRSPFTCADAQKINVPVLVLCGDQSPIGLQRIAESTAQCIKGAKFVRIAQATHWLQHDQPQRFNEQVLAFLGEQRK
jgi:pimeloyl-ACP methyl ester carboxylesterase